MASNSRGSMRPQNSGKTPSFIVVGLLVVIAILGFNYWNVSSKNTVLVRELSEMSEKLRITSVKKLAIEKRGESLLQKTKEVEYDLDKHKSLAQRKEEEVNNLNSQIESKKNELESQLTELNRVRQELDECNTNSQNIEMKLDQANEAKTECEVRATGKEECDRKLAEAMSAKANQALPQQQQQQQGQQAQITDQQQQQAEGVQPAAGQEGASQGGLKQSAGAEDQQQFGADSNATDPQNTQAVNDNSKVNADQTTTASTTSKVETKHENKDDDQKDSEQKDSNTKLNGTTITTTGEVKVDPRYNLTAAASNVKSGLSAVNSTISLSKTTTPIPLGGSSFDKNVTAGAAPVAGGVQGQDALQPPETNNQAQAQVPDTVEQHQQENQQAMGQQPINGNPGQIGQPVVQQQDTALQYQPQQSQDQQQQPQDQQQQSQDQQQQGIQQQGQPGQLALQAPEQPQQLPDAPQGLAGNVQEQQPAADQVAPPAADQQQQQLQAPDARPVAVGPDGQQAPQGEAGQVQAPEAVEAVDSNNANEVNRQDEGLIKAGPAGNHIDVDNDNDNAGADYKDGNQQAVEDEEVGGKAGEVDDEMLKEDAADYDQDGDDDADDQDDEGGADNDNDLKFQQGAAQADVQKDEAEIEHMQQPGPGQ